MEFGGRKIFIRKMNDEQRETDVSAAAALRGNPPKHRRRKYRVVEERIVRLKEEYINGRRNVQEYWDAMRYVVKICVQEHRLSCSNWYFCYILTA